MRVSFLFFFMTFQFIFAQKDHESLEIVKENDSISVSQKRIIDSLKNEIRKNIHNYKAIEIYGFYDDETIPINSGIPKFYDSLFSLIEKDKKIRPEYYSVRANIFHTRGEERSKIFKKGFLKFPNDYQINSELGNYYYDKFIESKDKNRKSLYADSTRFHLENYTAQNPLQFQKIKNLVELFQIYNFQKENLKMEKLEKEIMNNNFYGISMSTFLNKINLKSDSQAEDKALTFFYNIENINQFKNEFNVVNNSDVFFNFVWYRSFFKPIFIYIEERKGKYFISYLISKKADKIEKPFKTETKEITNEQFQNFINLLTKQNIEQSSVTIQPGYDGSSWYLESKTKNSHTLQEIWSPQINCASSDTECSTIKACLYLIKLSGLKTASSKIDNADYIYNPEEPDGFMIW